MLGIILPEFHQSWAVKSFSLPWKILVIEWNFPSKSVETLSVSLPSRIVFKYRRLSNFDLLSTGSFSKELLNASTDGSHSRAYWNWTQFEPPAFQAASRTWAPREKIKLIRFYKNFECWFSHLLIRFFELYMHIESVEKAFKNFSQFKVENRDLTQRRNALKIR